MNSFELCFSASDCVREKGLFSSPRIPVNQMGMVLAFMGSQSSNYAHPFFFFSPLKTPPFNLSSPKLARKQASGHCHTLSSPSCSKNAHILWIPSLQTAPLPPTSSSPLCSPFPETKLRHSCPSRPPSSLWSSSLCSGPFGVPPPEKSC